MSGVPYISVRQLLGNALSPLGRLTAASRRLGLANQALDEILDEPLKGRVCVARASAGTVTLVAESPAWSSRIRYLTPQILDHLRRRLENPRLSKVQIVTRPTILPSEPPVRPRPRLSGRSAGLIESVARSTDNPALARALMRLSGRVSDQDRD
ncbi:MAG: DUF721 domain-containing protein [Gammaproteobacteria bacterium]|nr:DUF721 domain-containing protein [Gammaproteobacteria bacterium]NIM74912.1 DUF721 domain-containing protein [Gammaproteobacteria bacterium]NIN39701.1 DUF721 domain-containing protein [Gammaproteobacteria bacterium]NIO26829.1 DUF721 domain-containing protein [Gammaproteobacteria bacterium]NIO67385.1 DUF721 domain-containing protein [Gammaproteobacteria bacterium]